MIAEDYDDTTNLKLFIRFFHIFDCSNQTVNQIFVYSQLETRCFDSVKSTLKQMQCRIRLTKKAKNGK